MAEKQKHLQKKEGEKRAGSSFIKPRPGSRRAASRESPAADILHLQRTLGNREVRRLIKSGAIQARLKIGKPNDKYEQEADRVADKVMRMPDPRGPAVQRESTCPECQEKEESVQAKPLADQITPLVQRQAEPEEEEEPIQAKLLQRQEGEEEEEEVQTKLQRQAEEEEEEPIQSKAAGPQARTAAPGVESKVQSLKGGGQPLPESTRSFFESRFGSDFSGVRVHNDSPAAETAKSINARAFTTGKDVVFGAGQYSPGTSSGKRLLAHEFTHVVQQKGTGLTSTTRSPAQCMAVRRNNIVQRKRHISSVCSETHVLPYPFSFGITSGTMTYTLCVPRRGTLIVSYRTRWKPRRRGHRNFEITFLNWKNNPTKTVRVGRGRAIFRTKACYPKVSFDVISPDKNYKLMGKGKIWLK